MAETPHGEPDGGARSPRQFCHDILNQLFIIQGRTEVVLLEIDPAHPLRDDIVEVHRACVRAVQITEDWRSAQQRTE